MKTTKIKMFFKKLRNLVLDLTLAAWFLLFLYSLLLLMKFGLTDTPDHSEVLVTISDSLSIPAVFDYLIWSNIIILFLPQSRKHLLHGFIFLTLIISIIAEIISYVTVLLGYIFKSLGFSMDFLGEKSDILLEYFRKIRDNDKRNYFKAANQALDQL